MKPLARGHLTCGRSVADPFFFLRHFWKFLQAHFVVAAPSHSFQTCNEHSGGTRSQPKAMIFLLSETSVTVPRAAVTRCYQLSGWNNRNQLSPGSGDWKSKVCWRHWPLQTLGGGESVPGSCPAFSDFLPVFIVEEQHPECTAV